MTTGTTKGIERVTQQFKAVEAGDIETLRTFYAPGAVIWHNYDDIAQPAADTFKMLGRVVEMTTRIEYQEQKITAVGNVHYVQHYFCAKLRDGGEIRTPVFMRVVLNDDGLITRLEEYIDSRAFDVSPAFAENVMAE